VHKKVLVTGATGFIGSRLVRKLLSEGNEVFALVRKSSNRALFSDVADRLHFAEGDVTDPVSLGDVFRGMDQVYHSAGYTYMGGESGKDALLDAINVDGTRNVMQAASEAGVGRVVHVSSITAMGFSRNPRKPLDETCAWNFSDLGLHYARTKHLAEKEVLKAIERGLDCVIVNPAFVFGAGDVNFNAGRLIKDVYRKKMPFYPLGGICVVDVEIVVETIISAMAKGRTGERYIIGGENLSYRQLADIIADVTGAPKIRIPLPYALAVPLHAFLQTLPSGGKVSRLFNLTMFRVASEFLYFSSEKAVRELGMRREPIRESISRAFNWYRKRGLL